jgi:hypothetical protein
MKLEDIHKDNIFKVPDRYFDELPGRIQSRITPVRDDHIPWFSWKVAAAVVVPAMVVLFFLIYTGTPNHTLRSGDPESMIAEVSAEDVIDYLELSDLSADEILEQVVFNDFDLTIDEEFPFFDDELDLDEKGFDAIMDQYDINI